jgi:hypothetical protein
VFAIRRRLLRLLRRLRSGLVEGQQTKPNAKRERYGDSIVNMTLIDSRFCVMTSPAAGTPTGSGSRRTVTPTRQYEALL